MYFLIYRGDGLRVLSQTDAQMRDWLGQISADSKHIRSDCQYRFVRSISELGPINTFLLVRGEAVIPEAKQIVTEFRLPGE